jgi:hypothetical protein
MMQTPAAESRLRDHERRARGAQHVVGGNAHVLVADVGVARVPLRLDPDTDVAHDVHARRLGGHDEHAHALVGRDVRIGHRHHDQEARPASVRREPLLAVDHPLIAVAPGARREQRGIGAGVRLGHRITRGDLAIEQRLEIALLLLRSSIVGEDLGVARVGRLTAEDRRRPGGAPEDLVHQRELELAVALPAELLAEVTGPEPALLHLRLERLHHRARARVGLVVRVAEYVVERLDLVAHECVDPVQLALKLRFGLEIPGHGSTSVGSHRFAAPARLVTILQNQRRVDQRLALRALLEDRVELDAAPPR